MFGQGIKKAAKGVRKSMNERAIGLCVKATQKLREVKGQGTTEYAILVGVLVVIAIIAVLAFKPAIEDLWNDIRDNINKLR